MIKTKAFTLIEVVVAAAVFAAVSIPIFYVFGTSQRNIQMTEAEFQKFANSVIQTLYDDYEVKENKG